MSIYREMGDVVEAVRNAKLRGRKCALLIGAGCSVSAGVPLASGFVNIIRKDWQEAYRRATSAASPEQPSYPTCMAELSDAERRDLIKDYVDKAKINWAHLAIAQLMKEGFVDRVLTTNFDPLVLRACTLVGVFPAVYDFAASRSLKPAYLPERAVFHLHGQHTGFILLHTDEQVSELSKSIEPLFEDAGRGRLWLVVGYSGEQDPVFQQLAKVDRFDERLYWVGYKDAEPATHVQQGLFQQEKSAFFVKGYNADDFFAALAQRLGCFPPTFVEKPFTHLSEMLGSVTAYTLPGQTSEIDIRGTAEVLIDEAVKKWELGPERNTLLADRYLLAGQYEAVLSLKKESMSPALGTSIAWALVMQGNELSDRPWQKVGSAADDLFQQAGEKYEAALQIKPDMHEALNNWGLALSDQAKQQTGAEADELFRQASEKYAAALQIKPDKHEALNNWGNALLEQAKQKTGAEADELYRQAGEKYAAALQIKPDKHEALYNWGSALLEQAKQKTGAEADELYRQAGEKYAAALQIKPDMHEALYNWGSALLEQAKQKTGAEADELYRQAGEKYAEALKVKPDKHEALNNWGSALSDQAKQKTGAEADELFRQAAEKYAAALQIKPDKHETLNNWGNALSAQAKRKTGAEAGELLRQAGEKYAAALQIKPDKHGVLYNWGNALSDQASQKTGAEADELLRQAGEKYAAALQIKPDKHEALYNWGNALLEQANQKTGAEADELYRQVGEKYAEALKIKPDKHEALYNWGNALSDHARQKTGAEADDLLRQAGEKYAAALQIKPDNYEALNDWGIALLSQFRLKTGSAAADVLSLARTKLEQAHSIRPGSSAYNLACYFALTGNESETQRWLEQARVHGSLPEVGDLEADADLESIRGTEWFGRFIAELRSENAATA